LNAPEVALEMAVIDQVKPQQSWKNPPIRLGDAIAGQVAARAKQAFQSIQAMKHFSRRFFVSSEQAKPARYTPLLKYYTPARYAVDFGAQILG
jgi:hypothetical protein